MIFTTRAMQQVMRQTNYKKLTIGLYTTNEEKCV